MPSPAVRRILFALRKFLRFDFLLQEDGFFLQQEDSASKILGE